MTRPWHNERAAAVLEAPATALTSPTCVEVKMATPANNTNLTAARLRCLFSYDPEVGHLVRRETTTCSKAGVPAGTLMKKGYRRIRVDNEVHLEHRLVWLYVTGEWPDDQLDHINGIKDDNRFANLRLATGSQNKANSPARSDSQTGIRGVSFRPKGQFRRATDKWEARITVDGRLIHLGSFRTCEEAEKAYTDAAEKYFGEFSWPASRAQGV